MEQGKRPVNDANNEDFVASVRAGAYNMHWMYAAGVVYAGST